jgi:hypothetical protein
MQSNDRHLLGEFLERFTNGLHRTRYPFLLRLLAQTCVYETNNRIPAPHICPVLPCGGGIKISFTIKLLLKPCSQQLTTEYS